MKKTTQKNIKSYVSLGMAKDITSLSFDEVEKIREACGGFDKVLYSCGLYGVNGYLLQGRSDGNFYTVTARSSAIFQI